MTMRPLATKNYNKGRKLLRRIRDVAHLVDWGAQRNRRLYQRRLANARHLWVKVEASRASQGHLAAQAGKRTSLQYSGYVWLSA